MKKDLVFDLDHTILYADINEREGYDFILNLPNSNPKYIYFRPFLFELLSFAQEHFNLHISTAGTADYAQAIREHLSQFQFDSVTSRESMKLVEVFDGYSKYDDYIKEISNSIIIDDKDYIFKGENNTILKVSPFFPSQDPKNIINDFVLKNIIDTLRQLV